MWKKSITYTHYQIRTAIYLLLFLVVMASIIHIDYANTLYSSLTNYILALPNRGLILSIRTLALQRGTLLLVPKNRKDRVSQYV